MARRSDSGTRPRRAWEDKSHKGKQQGRMSGDLGQRRPVALQRRERRVTQGAKTSENQLDKSLQSFFFWLVAAWVYRHKHQLMIYIIKMLNKNVQKSTTKPSLTSAEAYSHRRKRPCSGLVKIMAKQLTGVGALRCDFTRALFLSTLLYLHCVQMPHATLDKWVAVPVAFPEARFQVKKSACFWRWKISGMINI